MSSPAPAEVASAAMAAVMSGDREAWIGGFAPDAVLEDPVGLSSHRGTDAIAAFWDNGIAGLESVHFEIRRVHEAPGEAVVLADIAIAAPGGAGATYDAVLHYAVDDEGAIRSLRAFWDPESVMSQLASATS